jgi:hypothetical protein
MSPATADHDHDPADIVGSYPAAARHARPTPAAAARPEREREREREREGEGEGEI